MAMKRFVRVEPGRVEIFGPTLENLRGRVQLDLTTGAADDSTAESEEAPPSSAGT